MVGITSFGAYVPLLRLNCNAIAKGLKREKALANFDEDSITMAVAAVNDCLRGVERTSIDGLFFASTTSPYQEKGGAPIISVAADLRQDIITADFGNMLRAGSSALRSAVDAVLAGTARQIMVVAADTRLGAPGSIPEQTCGDGAAALLVGKDDPVAILEASYSVCHEITDVWRLEGRSFLKTWEGRFNTSEGYMKAMGKAVSGILKKTGLKPSDFWKVVLYTPDQRSSAGVAMELGFDVKSQLQDPLFGLIGDTGTPYAMMLMVAALEEAKPGDHILMGSYGNGADAFVFKVTDKIKDIGAHGGMQRHMSSKRIVDDYRTYLCFRGILPGTGKSSIYPIPFGSTSAPALLREVDKNLRLYGSKCEECGTVQYPPQRVCVKCHAKDRFQPVRLSDKKGKVYTFSVDHISSIVDSPSVIPVVDFEGGGRMECYMTDAAAEEVKIGMDVEMTFRRLFEREEIVNYFWKAMPVRFQL